MSRERSLSRRTVTRLTAGASTLGALAAGGALGAFDLGDGGRTGQIGTDRETVDLPDPETDGEVSVERAIALRRSRREYTDEPLTLATLGQLCWAMQGITQSRVGRTDFRAAPSAGATYPLELFVAIDDRGVEDLGAGVYRYAPGDHALGRVRSGSVHDGIAGAALEQSWIADAPIVVVLTAIDERTTERYGDRGSRRYVPMEAGHAAENLYLQAEALDLATVVVGAFRDDDVRSLLDLSGQYRPLYVIPVGHRP
ncbi:MAG: SagB/ThcOx family dehydrogenase [Halanaeroarchaeum sp.]